MSSEGGSRGRAGNGRNSGAVTTLQKEPLESMRIFWLFSLLVVVQATGQAQQAFPEQITTEQAVREALEKNLGLLAERYNLSIADARIITARLRPNPVFSFGADYLDWVGTKFSQTQNLGPSEVNFRTDFVL